MQPSIPHMKIETEIAAKKKKKRIKGGTETNYLPALFCAPYSQVLIAGINISKRYQ